MNAAIFKPLIGLTLRNPREGAAQVIAMNLPVQALWMMLTVISIISSLALSVTLQAALSTPELNEQVRLYFETIPGSNAPLLFAVIRLAQVVILVYVLFWVGRAMGGLGRLGDVLAVMTLLQIVSFLVLTVLFLLGLVISVLPSLGVLVFMIWLLWATIGVLDVAHGFGNPGKALGVLLVSLLGAIVGLSLLMGVLSAVFLGG